MKGITSFALHVMAMAFMACDHLYAASFVGGEWAAYLGRLAFPLFAFLTAEGFTRTGDLKKYALRLLACAVISEIPFNLLAGSSLFYPLHQNVLWTFLLSIAAMAILKRLDAGHMALRIVFYPVTIFAFYLLGIVTFSDYYGYGVLTVLLFYLTRRREGEHKAAAALRMAAQALGMYYINCEMITGLMVPLTLLGHTFEVYRQGFALLALPLIWLYRGEQGPYSKGIRRMYYLFYPAHMLILGGIRYLM